VWKPDQTDKRKGRKTGEKKRMKNRRGWTDCTHATWVGAVGCAPGLGRGLQVGSGTLNAIQYPGYQIEESVYYIVP
jgi:hypothetical protein